MSIKSEHTFSCDVVGCKSTTTITQKNQPNGPPPGWSYVGIVTGFLSRVADVCPDHVGEFEKISTFNRTEVK